MKHMEGQPVERVFTFGSQQLHSLVYSGPSTTVFVALHGWLDNAASFGVLAPLLARHGMVVALDLPGHGRSSHQRSYELYADLPVLRALLTTLITELGERTRVVLVGHSRGAFICELLAATCPLQVDAVVALDALVSPPVPAEEVVTQLKKFVKDMDPLAPGMQNAVFGSLDQAVMLRTTLTKEPDAVARAILARNLKREGNSWVQLPDARLKCASAVKMSLEQWQQVFREIACPFLFVSCAQGFGPKSSPEMIRFISKRDVLLIDGIHHAHMLSPHAEAIAQRIVTLTDAIHK